MTTRERIDQELRTLDEKELNEIYGLVKGWIDSKKRTASPGLIAKLKRVKINAPADFATNLDQYVSGEKRAE